MNTKQKKALVAAKHKTKKILKKTGAGKTHRVQFFSKCVADENHLPDRTIMSICYERSNQLKNLASWIDVPVYKVLDFVLDYYNADQVLKKFVQRLPDHDSDAHRFHNVQMQRMFDMAEELIIKKEATA